MLFRSGALAPPISHSAWINFRGARPKKLEVSPPTYHRWRQEYGGAKEETVKRLKELEKENVQLKKLVADLSLDKAMIKELVEGKW